MKTKSILLTLILAFATTLAWAKELSISQTIANINADAQKPGGEERALKSISASTHLPVTTLAQEKASTGLTCGDLYIAHAIASASGKSFNEIVKLKKHGQSWDKIADANHVTLGGKKASKPATNTQEPRAPKVEVPHTPDVSGYRSMP